MTKATNAAKLYDQSKQFCMDLGLLPDFDSASRLLEYAEKFVEATMSRFQGGVKNMTEASMYIIRCQRAEINKLKD